MEWSIQELARAAGVTSRTLRHYGERGLLAPSRIGANGYRYYDDGALVRLQRILLLRELGLGLAAIAAVLAGTQDTPDALRGHLASLRAQGARLERQIAAVTTTIRKLENGEPLMPAETFDGFDHTQYREEVIERWGAEAYERTDAWWRAQSDDDKRAFQQRHEDIARDYGAAHSAGLAPSSSQVQAIAARHAEWLSTTQDATPDYLRCMGQMYVDDPRFAANYDKYGDGTASFVRDALVIYADGASKSD